MIELKQATPDQHDEIYRLGIDVWGKYRTENDYLKECRESVKYQAGTWYVLLLNEQVVCAAIVYDFKDGNFGIGSLATRGVLRKQGFASDLLNRLISLLKTQVNVKNIFLWADIEPAFYERFGFERVENDQNSGQHLMTLCCNKEHQVDDSVYPSYF